MSTIEKIAVYDARIIQESPKYAVQKGALSVSVSPFNAISASASQHTYQILVPSLNVFVDRKIDLTTGAYVSMEAVPSQYSSIPYNLGTGTGVAGSSLIKSMTLLPIPDQYSPTSNAIYQIDCAQAPGFSETLLQANSTIEFASGITLATGTYSSGGASGASTVVLSYTSGVNFVSLEAARTLLVNSTVTGSGGISKTVSSVVFTAPNLVTVTVPGTWGAQVAGVLTFTSVSAVTQSIDRVEYFTATDQTGAAVTASQYARLYMSVLGGVFANLQNVQLRTSGGQIATPVFASTADTIVLPQEVISASGARGFGLNSGFLLPRGSFAGCTGPTDNNWYQPVGGPTDLSLCMFPVQSLCTNMTASINDCSVTTNGDTLKEQILLSQTRDSLMQRTTPSKFDVYAWAIDDARSANGSTRSYGSAKDSDIGNGSWQIEFVNPNTGLPLPQFGSYTFNGVKVPIINYKPAFIPQGSSLVGKTISDPNDISVVPVVIDATTMSVPVPVMIRFYTSEPLVMSPFLWQDAKEMTEVGLYGCTNISLTMNLQGAGPTQGYDTLLPPSGSTLDGRKYYVDRLSTLYPTNASIIRSTGLHALYSKIALSNPTGNTTSNTGPFISPKLQVTFLTPPPDVTLPMVSTVPYMEFPRYFSPCTVPAQAGLFQINSNTITLSSIPDILAVFVKANVRGQTQQETYIPISKIGVTFDNYSNLCSNFSQEDLYACSAAGGLDMDWQQFRGYTSSTFATDIPFASQSGQTVSSMLDLRKQAKTVQLSGGPLLLRMGQDIPLSPGLAPGTLGNFSVQLNITCDNSFGFFSYLQSLSSSNNASIVIMALNSGFFETVRGQSAVRKTILNSVDVEAASVQSGVTSTHLRRLVGGARNGTIMNSDLGSAMDASSAVSEGRGGEMSQPPAKQAPSLY